jgi:hypothetical protein
MDFSEFGLGGQSNRVFGARGGAFFKHVNLGVEALIRRWVFLRLGFHQGYWTAGIGVDARFAKLDLATYQEEMSSSPGRLGSRRIALRLAFGVSGRAPRAVESATEATTEVKTEGKPETETTGGPKAPINPVENAVDVPAGKADVLGPGPKDENLGDDLKKENP